jgi:uncharacterized protein YjbJ (UPF0337 family)
MSESKMDDLKGRAKEALGSLTDDEDLKKEGRTDQRAADVKEGIERLGDKAKDVVDDVKRRTR